MIAIAVIGIGTATVVAAIMAITTSTIAVTIETATTVIVIGTIGTALITGTATVIAIIRGIIGMTATTMRPCLGSCICSII